MKNRFVMITVASALAMLPLPCAAPAHDPGLSTMSVKLLDREIQVRVTLTREEAATAFDSSPDAATARAVELFADGKQIDPSRSGAEVVDNVEIDLQATFPRSAGARRLRVAVPFIGRLAHGHRQYVMVSDAGGTVVVTGLLSAADLDLEFDLSN